MNLQFVYISLQESIQQETRGPKAKVLPGRKKHIPFFNKICNSKLRTLPSYPIYHNRDFEKMKCPHQRASSTAKLFGGFTQLFAYIQSLIGVKE